MATGSCEVHRTERPPWHRAASELELARGTTTIATVTSQSSGYIRTVDTQWLRGHGQSVVMTTELIILLLQDFPRLSTDTVTCIEQENGHQQLRGASHRKPAWHCAASGLEHARRTTPIVTVTSKRSGYIRTVDTQRLRGQGQSVVMRTELIILLLRVFLCSAPTPSPASSKKTTTGSCEHRHRHLHREGKRPPAAATCIASKDHHGIVLLLN
ncbi:hypothetical protein MRX96_007415 [Rhipicephalus microplus]